MNNLKSRISRPNKPSPKVSRPNRKVHAQSSRPDKNVFARFAAAVGHTVNSFKFKVSILYTVFLGGILVSFCTALYFALSFYLYQEIDTRLMTKAQETLATVKSYIEIVGEKPGVLDFAVQKTFFYQSDFSIGPFDTGKIKKLDTKWQERADVLGLSDSYIVFVSSDNERVIVSKNFPSQLLPLFLKIEQLPQAINQLAFNNVNYKDDLIRVVSIPYFAQDKNRHLIHIGVSQRPVAELLSSLARTMVTGVPLVLVLTSFVGLIFVKRILDPIEEIAKTANQITHEDLASRVKTQHWDSEIQYLVDSFNDMILRLERSFKHINDFSSHVAHELKTPLAIIKGEAEVILSRERSAQEYKSALVIVLGEADRMRKTVEDILLLAKLDYQPEIFKFELFDFRKFFVDICEQTRVLAADKKLEIKTSIPKQGVMIKADRLHLRRLFFNLIDNALKFTSSPGEIALGFEMENNHLIVTVSDTGQGIAEEELPRIFEKFYHSDPVDMDSATGNGLGLSIVQSIVNIHKGSIQVKSTIGIGTTFRVTLSPG